MLERTHPSEECWLQTQTSAGGLCDLEQKLAVRGSVPESVDDAVVAIHLDCQAEASDLPPHGEVPGHQYQGERHHEKQSSVVRFAVLFLVANDVLPLFSGQCEHPLREQNP
jgi:hypothetical protein